MYQKFIRAPHYCQSFFTELMTRRIFVCLQMPTFLLTNTSKKGLIYQHYKFVQAGGFWPRQILKSQGNVLQALISPLPHHQEHSTVILKMHQTSTQFLKLQKKYSFFGTNRVSLSTFFTGKN